MLDRLNYDYSTLKIPDLNGGVNLSEEPYKLEKNQMSELINMIFDKGVLKKRDGYENLFEDITLSSVIAHHHSNGVYYLALNDRIISYNSLTGSITNVLENVINDRIGYFIEKHDVLYYFSGNAIYKMERSMPKFTVGNEISLSSINGTPIIALTPYVILTTSGMIYDFSSEVLRVYDSGLNKYIKSDLKPVLSDGRLLFYTTENALNWVYSFNVVNTEGRYSLVQSDINYCDNSNNPLYSIDLLNNIVLLSFTSQVKIKDKLFSFLTKLKISNGSVYCYLVSDNRLLAINRFGGLLQVFYYSYDLAEGTVTKLSTATLSANAPTGKITYQRLTDGYLTISLGNDLYLLNASSDSLSLCDSYVFENAPKISNINGNYYISVGESTNTHYPFRFFNRFIELSDKITTSQSGMIIGNVFFRGGYYAYKISTLESKMTEVSGYIPTVFKVISPEGACVFPEEFNALSPQAKAVVDSQAVVKSIVIPVKNIEILSVEGNISYTKELTPEAYTKITFNTAQLKAVILFSVGGFTDDIRKCSICAMYGGNDSGTRLFVTGNPNKPTTIFYSDVNNIEYFPESRYDLIDFNNEPICAFGRLNNNLIAFKENSMHAISYINGGGSSYFSISMINGEIGCDAPSSVLFAGGGIVFANSCEGLFLLENGLKNEQYLVSPLSHNIKKALLNHDRESIKKASAICFDSKYYISIADKVYIWDYGTTPYYNSGDKYKAQKRLAFYVFDNINAACFIKIGSSLGFFKSSHLSLNRFSELLAADCDMPFNAFFSTSAFDFDAPNYTKNMGFLNLVIDCDEKISLMCETFDEDFALGKDIITVTPKKRFYSLMSKKIRNAKVNHFKFSISNISKSKFKVSDMEISYYPLKIKK